MAASKPVVSFGVGGVGEYLVPARTVAARASGSSSTARMAPARAAVLDRFQVQDQLRKYAVLYTRLKAGADLGDLPWVLS